MCSNYTEHLLSVTQNVRVKTTEPEADTNMSTGLPNQAAQESIGVEQHQVHIHPDSCCVCHDSVTNHPHFVLYHSNYFS